MKTHSAASLGAPERSSGAVKPAVRTLIGRERTPVLVIDGVSEFTAGLQEAAGTAAFEPDGTSMYPGLRARMPREPALAILQGVYRQLYKLYGIPGELRLRPKQANLSLVTKSPGELELLQRIPHFDTSSPYFFALLLYLNPGSHGPTGFFRHIPTGYERIGDERVDDYLAAANLFNEKYGAPVHGYPDGTSDQYELYHQVDYRQHRLAIYPGNLLHSILVEPSSDIDPNPETGRLTANIFFEFS